MFGLFKKKEGPSPRDVLEKEILALLAKENELSASRISIEISEDREQRGYVEKTWLGSTSHVSLPRVFMALKRLEDKNLIATYYRTDPDRERRVFSLARGMTTT